MPRIIALADLTPHQRRRGILALAISTFFAWGGFFLIIPLVTVYYVDSLGWAVGAVGIVLAVRQFTQQALTTAFGVLSDRVGPKRLIGIGMGVRAMGFAALAWTETFWPTICAVALAGLGGAMFESPKAAALASFATAENRQRVFAVMGVISGVGVTLGTQLGALLIRVDFAVVCLTAASAYLIVAVGIVLLMPNVAISTTPAGSMAGLRAALADRTFVLFLLVLAGFWFIWVQFSLTVILAATDITGSGQSLAWMYAVNSGITVVLGYLLPRLLERWLSPIGLVMVGTATIGIGLGSIAFATGLPMLLAAAAIYAVGSVLVRPGEQTVTANLAPPDARGTYFGVAALSLALGGGLGNVVGGLFVDLGRSQGLPALPWALFFLIGVGSAAAMFVLRNRFAEHREATESPGAAAITMATSAESAPAMLDETSTRVDTPLPHRR